jgi:ribosomal protein L7/L12
MPLPFRVKILEEEISTLKKEISGLKTNYRNLSQKYKSPEETGAAPVMSLQDEQEDPLATSQGRFRLEIISIPGRNLVHKIKNLRQQFNCSLREAKSAVREVEDKKPVLGCLSNDLILLRRWSSDLWDIGFVTKVTDKNRKSL